MKNVLLTLLLTPLWLVLGVLLGIMAIVNALWSAIVIVYKMPSIVLTALDLYDLYKGGYLDGEQ